MGLRRRYLKFCQFIVIELICAIAVFVVQKFDLCGTRVFRILNKFLKNKTKDIIISLQSNARVLLRNRKQFRTSRYHLRYQVH